MMELLPDKCLENSLPEQEFSSQALKYYYNYVQTIYLAGS